MSNLKPPKNYRVAKGKPNCGNCAFGEELPETKYFISGRVECQRDQPIGLITREVYCICDGHKREEANG